MAPNAEWLLTTFCNHHYLNGLRAVRNAALDGTSLAFAPDILLRSRTHKHISLRRRSRSYVAVTLRVTSRTLANALWSTRLITRSVMAT